MKIAFRRMIDRFRKRAKRNGGLKTLGIKSLECNFNPQKRTYNPHYHLIVPNKQIANAIVIEWQRIWNKKQKLTLAFAQDSQKVNNLQSALIEVIKYGSKIFTGPDINKKTKNQKNRKIYAATLDNIFEAFDNSRLFDRFGFNYNNLFRNTETKISILENYDEWEYFNEVNDWVNKTTGELLTDYYLPGNLHDLLSNDIDTTIS